MKNRFIDFILVAVIVVVNIFFLKSLVYGEFTGFLPSIESVFLAEAQFILDKFPSIFWYPFWYFGLPFHLVYQPIPIFLTALISAVTATPVSYSYRILTLFFLTLGTLGTYSWIKYLSKSRISALAGAAVYSLSPSIAYLFLSSSWASYGLVPLRLINTFVYGEGPHMWGLSLIPFACLFFQKLLIDPKKRINWLMSVLLTTYVLLTSLTAFVGLTFLLFFIFFIQSSRSSFTKSLIVTLIVFLFSSGLSFFWYNPEFIKGILDYSLGDGGGVFTGIWSHSFFSILLGLLLLIMLRSTYAFLNSKIPARFLKVILPASLFVFLYIEIYAWFSWNRALLPLPFRTIPRLIPELELTFAVFIAVLIASFSKKVRYLVAAIIIFISVSSGLSQRDNIIKITSPSLDFNSSSEYVISKKLDEIKAKRIYATGTHAFWLNLFTDTTQLRGGKGGDFGGLNPWWAHLSYFINRGDDTDLTKKWLRSLGIEYIVVNYPGSPAYYHDYNNIDRFSDLKEIYDYQGDKILKLPTKNTGMVLALPPGWTDGFEKVKDLNSGKIVLDKERLGKYYDFVEFKAKPLDIEYPFVNYMRIRIPAGQIEDNKEVLIRQTYYPGWSAESNGQKLVVTADPIGFTLIKNPGSGEIVLTYRPVKLISAIFVSFIFLIAFLLFLKKNYHLKLA